MTRARFTFDWFDLTPPLWALEWAPCHPLQLPSVSLYLLVDVSRDQPVGALLTPSPRDADLGAWLLATTICRRPPETLRVDSRLLDTEWGVLRDWCYAHHVAIARRTEYGRRDPAEALLCSAMRALDALGDADPVHLRFQAAQVRLDRWYRQQGAR